MPGDPRGSWRRLSSAPSAEGGGPQPAVGHSPPPQGYCGICQERTIPGAFGVGGLAFLCPLRGAGIGQPSLLAISGHGARDQVLIGAGTRDVEPRWFGGQAGAACKGTGSGAGRPHRGSSAEEVAADLPVSLAQQVP